MIVTSSLHMIMILTLNLQILPGKTYLKVCLLFCLMGLFVIVFLNYAMFVLSDAKIDCAGKSIEDTGEPGGGIFCAVCITYCAGGTRVEDGDLTTHLRSETHEIEVSIILLTSSYLVFCITNQSLLVNRCLGSLLRLYLTAS